MASATTGSLADRPLAHLLVYVADKQLSGTLELTNGAETATIVFSTGEIAKIRTSKPVAYLGGLLHEMGLIDAGELNASLLELAKQKRPHGQILLDRKTIVRAQLAAGLREQALRKLAHLFSFRPQALFTFHAGEDLLPSYGGGEVVLTDPFPAIWRGIREFPSVEHVRDVALRIGDAPCRLTRGARIDRFHFEPELLAVTGCLRMRAIGMREIGERLLAPKLTELLLYCLLITKQLEIVGVAPLTSLSNMPAVKVSSATMPAATISSPANVLDPRVEPTSKNLRAAAPVPVRTSSSPSNPQVVAAHLAREKTIRDRATKIRTEDLFQRLSLPRDAGRQQVDDAFTTLARMWNPADLPPTLEAARADCALVLSMLSEARETLVHAGKRAEYMRKLSQGPQLPDAASDLAASGEKNDYDGAKACLANNDLDRAERMARRAHKAQADQAPPLALLAWVAAQKPENQGVEATRARIMMLDKAVKMDPECQEALWFRAQLHKRIENHAAAMADLQRLTALNPDNVDAVRELRMYEMRVRRNSISMKPVRPSGGLLDRFRKK